MQFIVGSADMLFLPLFRRVGKSILVKCVMITFTQFISDFNFKVSSSPLVMQFQLVIPLVTCSVL